MVRGWNAQQKKNKRRGRSTKKEKRERGDDKTPCRGVKRWNLQVTHVLRSTCSKNACVVAPIATASSGTRPVPKGVPAGKQAFTDEFTFGICAIPALEGPWGGGIAAEEEKKRPCVLKKKSRL